VHPLKAWLRQNSVSLDEFAGRLNDRGVRTRQGTKITEIYLSHVLTGHRRPWWPVAEGIAAETVNEVTASAMMNWTRSPAESNAA